MAPKHVVTKYQFSCLISQNTSHRQRYRFFGVHFIIRHLCNSSFYFIQAKNVRIGYTLPTGQSNMKTITYISFIGKHRYNAHLHPAGENISTSFILLQICLRIHKVYLPLFRVFVILKYEVQYCTRLFEVLYYRQRLSF